MYACMLRLWVFCVFRKGKSVVYNGKFPDTWIESLMVLNKLCVIMVIMQSIESFITFFHIFLTI